MRARHKPRPTKQKTPKTEDMQQKYRGEPRMTRVASYSYNVTCTMYVIKIVSDWLQVYVGFPWFPPEINTDPNCCGDPASSISSRVIGPLMKRLPSSIQYRPQR